MMFILLSEITYFLYFSASSFQSLPTSKLSSYAPYRSSSPKLTTWQATPVLPDLVTNVANFENLDKFEQFAALRIASGLLHDVCLWRCWHAWLLKYGRSSILGLVGHCTNARARAAQRTWSQAYWMRSRGVSIPGDTRHPWYMKAVSLNIANLGVHLWSRTCVRSLFSNH
jgi:hypothetical protein